MNDSPSSRLYGEIIFLHTFFFFLEKKRNIFKLICGFVVYLFQPVHS